MGEESSGTGESMRKRLMSPLPHGVRIYRWGSATRVWICAPEQACVVPPPSWDCRSVEGLSFPDLWPPGGDVQEADKYPGLGRRQHVDSISVSRGRAEL